MERNEKEFLTSIRVSALDVISAIKYVNSRLFRVRRETGLWV